MNREEIKQFGAWLKEARKNANLTQAQLASELEVHMGTISAIEQGTIASLGRKLHARIEAYFTPRKDLRQKKDVILEDENEGNVMMNDDLVKFADWMRNERENRKLTQREFAEIVGISLSTIQGLEAHRANTLSARIREKIINTLNNKPDVREQGAGYRIEYSLDSFRPYLLRLAALVATDDFDNRVNSVSNSLHIQKVLAIVYIFEEEIKNKH